jgi:hypothetical protein
VTSRVLVVALADQASKGYRMVENVG